MTTIDRPGLTVVRGINARGDLVGRYVDASAGNKERGYVFWRGFVPSHADGRMLRFCSSQPRVFRNQTSVGPR